MLSRPMLLLSSEVEAVWRRWIVALLVATAAMCVTARPGLACTVCIPVPEKTVADRLLASEVVVLAREDPGRPFSYAPVEVLRGSFDGAPIDLFLDSTTRRKLARFPERSVVLAGSGGEWRNLGFAGAAYEQIVREILSADWRDTDDARRLEYFADLLDHDERSIVDLAYLEVGRAPYGVIKSLSDRMKPDHLRRILTEVRYYEWRPLAVLMLPHAGNHDDHRYIERSFDSAQKHRIHRHLAAWTTAYIEIAGEDAIDRVDELYFQDPRRSDAEIGEVIKALSVHGSGGHVHLRDRIVEAYATLLDNRPSMVGHAARDLAAWEDWSLAARVREIVKGRHGLDNQTLFTVGYYLGLASEGDRLPETAAAVR